jgi:hypothetical protein
MGRLVYLLAGVADPDPDAFLDDVLTGWRRVQLAQNFSPDTTRRRVASVCGWASFVGAYPWQWTAADADDFFGHLRGVRNLAHTTVRAYQTGVKLFLDYATDPAYDWNEHCGRRFGTVFSQVITEFDKARHVQADWARSHRQHVVVQRTADEQRHSNRSVTGILPTVPSSVLHDGITGG